MGGSGDGPNTGGRRDSFRRAADKDMYAIASAANQMATVALGKIEQHEAVCTERYAHTKETMTENRQRLAGIEDRLSKLPDELEKNFAESGTIVKLSNENKLIMRIMVYGGTLFMAGLTGLLWYFLSGFMDSIRHALTVTGHPVQ